LKKFKEFVVQKSSKHGNFYSHSEFSSKTTQYKWSLSKISFTFVHETKIAMQLNNNIF